MTSQRVRGYAVFVGAAVRDEDFLVRVLHDWIYVPLHSSDCVGPSSHMFGLLKISLLLSFSDNMFRALYLGL